MSEPGEEAFALAGGRRLVLHESGLLHPAGAAQGFTPWVELVHVTLEPRTLAIGALRGTWRIPRRAFLAPDGAAEAARALEARLAALPDGAVRAERQRALERRLRERRQPWLGTGPALASNVPFVLGLFQPLIPTEGGYWGRLGLLEEPWRLVTAQLLHENVPHLALNSLGLVALVGILERQLGALRAALVLAGAGLGAMLGCAVAAYEFVVGASGLVAGAAGALLALEWLRPDLLPATWRLPRRWLLGAIVADAVILLFVPRVAHAAHLGGFLAGGAVALAVAPAHAAAFREQGRALRAAAAGVAVLVLLSLGSLARGVADPAGTAARSGARLLAEGRADAVLLNNYAWTVAVAERASEDELRVALRLARRAVRQTRRSDPNLLDTLAEVYFRSGRTDDALETIDEAIVLAPEEPYFREQRRRFRGERAADDRPEPPAEGPRLPPDPEPAEGADAPGLRV